MWKYYTNITPETQRTLQRVMMRQARRLKKVSDLAERYPKSNLERVNKYLKRAFEKYGKLRSKMPSSVVKYYIELLGRMETIYSKTSVDQINCEYPDSCKSYDLEPHLTEILAKNRNLTELDYYWDQWFTKVGRKVKPHYIAYIDIMNRQAKSVKKDSAADLWLESYEEIDQLGYNSKDFQREIDGLWDELRPLYEKLHGFVRHRLFANYPGYSGHKNPVSDSGFNEKTGSIPSNVFGNMWAQNWINIQDIVKPYPEEMFVLDVTDALVSQNYTAKKMFELSEEFFTSIGMDPMTPDFWKKSMLEKPADGRRVVCHASAWDFGDKKDFRIKQCTNVNHDNLVTVHHEMGHVVYFQQYARQEYSCFRDGANPGFHEAIGDTISLSVATPKHLRKVGLLKESDPSFEQTINYQMSMALEKLAFLPFGLLIDKYRWKIFDGKISVDNLQEEWDRMRLQYQGIHPPVKRDSNLFDAGAKYHVPANVPYIRYFVSHILQFQFYKALCMNHPKNEPLHNCDFYQDKEAGRLLAIGLQLGSSKPWQETLKMMTGSEKMSAAPLREYFGPLENWLDREIAENSIPVGW